MRNLTTKQLSAVEAGEVFQFQGDAVNPPHMNLYYLRCQEYYVRLRSLESGGSQLEGRHCYMANLEHVSNKYVHAYGLKDFELELDRVGSFEDVKLGEVLRFKDDILLNPNLFYLKAELGGYTPTGDFAFIELNKSGLRYSFHVRDLSHMSRVECDIYKLKNFTLGAANGSL